MEVYDGIDSAKGRLVVPAVALGNFDGVHIGHQRLLAEALCRARARGGTFAALTFEPHPGKVLSPSMAPPLICPLRRRLEVMQALGLDAAIVQPFDRAFAARSPEAFLAEDLLAALGARDLVVGPDFTYGRDRTGNVESLKLQCQERGVGLAVVSAVDFGGLVVSSTKIRELVLEGRVAGAERLLGRPFDLEGKVVGGAGRGRHLGFPTANLAPENELRPGGGVYAVRAFLAGKRVFAGAANVGHSPTFGGGEVTIEVHLLDFEGDLYGEGMAVEFLERLRPEVAFGGPAMLAAQIARDVADARRVAAAAPAPGRLSPWR